MHEEDDANATRVWSGESPPAARRATAMLAIVALVLVGVIAAALSLIAFRHAPQQVATLAKPPTSAADSRVPIAVEDQWWTPSNVPRESISALAYGFPGIDEHDLGRPYTADLKPIYDAAALFEERQVKHVTRNELERETIRLRDVGQFNAGFQALFASAGVSYSGSREYILYRAGEINEVVKLDETGRMHKPPEQAALYLAEVYRGASYDVMVDAEASEMGAKLSATFEAGTPSFSNLSANSRYHLVARGLGLSDETHDGIFAATPAEIAKRYRTGPPVPVTLVFRTIPGRKYHPKKLAMASVVVDEHSRIPDGATTKIWSIPVGQYHMVTESHPNGLRVEWLDGGLVCEHGPTGYESKTVDAICVVDKPMRLRFANPSAFNLGPAEEMDLYVARMP